MKKALCGLAALLIAASTTPVLPGVGNGAPSGAHYDLNIIGVANPKTSPMTDSGRHTIFVGLGQTDTKVTSKIYLIPGSFAVCDGNAFDPAFDCLGAQIQGQGAVFQLPCNTSAPSDITCGMGTVSASYTVWARALGQPGGSAVITTCGTDETGTVVCSSSNTLNVLTRHPGKESFTNVTNELTTLTGCYVQNGTTICQTVPLFSGGLQDFFWQYDNNHLKLAQLRFYLNP
ncbi:MAG: hypothetical protein AUG09_02495 [Acidobacteria bacterium 13_1_20CM_2_68_7]|nr:MAG: hypothetical protein AUG09_02495 [Acidobacteria bacterium 13_1_20CM_2_68_7]